MPRQLLRWAPIARPNLQAIAILWCRNRFFYGTGPRRAKSLILLHSHSKGPSPSRSTGPERELESALGPLAESRGQHARVTLATWGFLERRALNRAHIPPSPCAISASRDPWRRRCLKYGLRRHKAAGGTRSVPPVRNLNAPAVPPAFRFCWANGNFRKFRNCSRRPISSTVALFAVLEQILKTLHVLVW